MKEFNQLCAEFEKMDVLSYTTILTEKSAEIIPALSVLTEDGVTGTAVFATFVMGAIAADGRLAEEEYILIEPLLKAFFGESVNYSDCAKLVRSMKKESRELRKSVDEMVDMLGVLSEDLKADIIIVCMMICAVDGKISLAEKNWIRQLIR